MLLYKTELKGKASWAQQLEPIFPATRKSESGELTSALELESSLGNKTRFCLQKITMIMMMK
jgi:hypothetical protein